MEGWEGSGGPVSVRVLLPNDLRVLVGDTICDFCERNFGRWGSFVEVIIFQTAAMGYAECNLKLRTGSVPPRLCELLTKCTS